MLWRAFWRTESVKQMDKIEIYTAHDGTLKISGKTVPKDAGVYACDLLKRGVAQIDFFYIGANAGHQATKSMGVFKRMFEEANPGMFEVSFVPNCFLTYTEDAKHEERIATVWRTVIQLSRSRMDKVVGGLQSAKQPEASRKAAG